jgi:hypothetical protein
MITGGGPSTGVGIDLYQTAAKNNLINKSVGTISGAIGVDGLFDVTNYGQINGAMVAGDGGLFVGRNDVSNASSATISGFYAIRGVGVAITNSGTLTGNTSSGVGALGVGNLINQTSGVISGAEGVRGYGDSGVYVNYGLITASSNWALDIQGKAINRYSGSIIGGGGIAAATVLNYGLIVANSSLAGIEADGTRGAATNFAKATVTGRTGIVASTSDITNYGEVKASETGISLFLSSVTNLPLGAIAGSNGIYGEESTVMNMGVIAADSLSGTGVLAKDSTITNAGTISGETAVSFGSAYIYQNRLIALPSAVFIGTVDGGKALPFSKESILEFASGAADGTVSGLGTKYINFEQVTVDSGADWLLNGANTLVTGVTLTNSGTFEVDGSLVGDRSAINGDVVDDGTISASGGTLLVNGAINGTGTLNVGTGATLEVTGTLSDAVADNFLGGGVLKLDASLQSGDMLEVGDDGTLELDADVGSTDTVDFTGAGELLLKDQQDFTGSIQGFSDDDSIYLPNYQPSSSRIGVDYSSNSHLSVQGLGTIQLTGSDIVPTFDFTKDANGGTDITTVSLSTLLALAQDTYNTQFVGAPGYSVLKIAQPDAGFEAVAYKKSNPSGGASKIVVAIRGTVPSFSSSPLAFIKNWVGNYSFASSTPDALLQRYVRDAAYFLASIATDPNNKGAQIVVTGHSLGGAIAQLLGKESGFATAAFNAPGTGQLFDALAPQLVSVDGLGDGGTNINYRLVGDLVSLVGKPIEQVYSLPSPDGTNASTPAITAALQVLDNHKLQNFPNLQTSLYTKGFPDANLLSKVQSIASSLPTIEGGLLHISLNVLAGELSLIDPNPGSSFTLTADPGSPDISAIVLPSEPGVASYDVSYQIGTTSSPFVQIQPGATDDLPAGVTTVTFAPLDSSNNPVVISSSFYLGIACSTSGIFSGTLSESGGAPFPEPVTTPVSLTLAPGASATPLDIPAPTDPSDSNASDFASLITGLPSNATVTLADGKTSVTLNESLTTEQLMGLEVAPIGGMAGAASALTYTVTDASFASDSGAANITVACFAAGAHILTVRGQVLVEDLRIGDQVIMLDDRRLARVVWLGHRRISCRHHPHPTDVWPLRVRAGAFNYCLPTRYLLLSPDHAVFVDGALIPIRHLINGSTIVQEQVDEVTYYHVELATHDVILAEGLPCESYLDTGNRQAIAGKARVGATWCQDCWASSTATT